MHAHRVKVFDRTNDDALILMVAHDLHLVLFPTQETFFDQDLGGGRGIETGLHHLFILFSIVGDAATGTTQCKAGPNDNGELADQFISRGEGITQIVYRSGFGHIQTDLDHGLLKDVAGFALFNGLRFGADHFDSIFFEDTGGM